MKTNGKKAIIATMAIAMAAGIAGSISGTVAWFQYNTRVTAEFEGTTVKCTEFLQVRVAKRAVTVKEEAASQPGSGSGYALGERYYNSTEKKVHTCIGLTGDVPVFDAGFDAVNGGIYDVNGTNKKYDGSSLVATNEPADLYGDWKTSIDNSDVLVGTGGLSGNGLKPVTAPTSDHEALGTLYGQPVCGYETYEGGYHWQTAEASDYYGFDLEFRVLDVDGTETGASPNVYAQDLYLTDISVAEYEVANKEDISSAIRIFVDGGAGKKALLAPGSGAAADVTTVTHGALDLGGTTGLDTVRDVPNNYSFSDNAEDVLDYGKDKPNQVAFDMNKKMTSNNLASNGVYPQNDGMGHLSGGKVLGKTAATYDGTHPKISFTVFLEGWQRLGGARVITATAKQLADAEPATPAAGDTYINTGSNKLFTYDGSSWGSGVALENGKFYSVGGVDYKYVDGGATVADRYVAQSSLSTWSSADYIGAKFNIGMSFGVTTLD